MEKKFIKRIYEIFSESVILLLDNGFHTGNKSIILNFTYVSPKGSSLYDMQTQNGIELMQDKITAIASDLPDTSFIIAGDLNARVKDLHDYIPCDDLDFVFNQQVDYPCDIFQLQRKSRDRLL